MASPGKINGMTKDELRAIFRGNAQKARPFVYMSDSDDSYESEINNGLRTPESLLFSPQPQHSSAEPLIPKADASKSSSGQSHRVQKHKSASTRYPRTRSRLCDHVWLDNRRKNFVNYKPWLGKLIQCSFNTYTREHDPERQKELWGHLTPAQRRDREFRKERASRTCASYIELPDGTLKILEPRD